MPGFSNRCVCGVQHGLQAGAKAGSDHRSSMLGACEAQVLRACRHRLDAGTLDQWISATGASCCTPRRHRSAGQRSHQLEETGAGQAAAPQRWITCSGASMPSRAFSMTAPHGAAGSCGGAIWAVLERCPGFALSSWPRPGITAKIDKGRPMIRLFCKTSRIAAARRTKINIAGEWTAHYGLHRPTGYGGDKRRRSHRGGA
jgi:hypothetical protein